MASYEELVAASAAVKRVLDDGAEATLRAIPGVVHVAVGLKERARTVTDELSIRVYVREKRPEDQLAPAERVPREIGGVATDVNVVRRFGFAVDAARYRPLKGGIMISNQIVGLNESGTGTTMEAGTFGCTATLLRDDSPVLLSNWHVLMANGAQVGEPIFQPVPLTLPHIPLARLPVRHTENDDVIAHIVDSAITDKVDAAIARLDVSSCCRCCGLDFDDEIVGLSDAAHPPWNSIVDRRLAVAGALVYKVGISTGRTVGRVVTATSEDLQGHINGQDYTLTGQIEIESFDSDEPFSARGDSGAAIIDDEGYIVGLLFGSTPDDPPDHRTYANHIDDVCEALGIEINFDPDVADLSGARVVVPRKTFATPPTRSGAELYAAARARLLADPAGAWLWALGEMHREELVRLVTTHRPVTVAWHRAGGPAVFAGALNTLRAGGDRLPTPPGGVTLESALVRVGDALAVHGSPALREALATHREVLLAAVRGAETLDDVLAKLGAALPMPDDGHAVSHANRSDRA